MKERYSYAGGRRSVCRSFGLKPSSSGCTSALRAEGWSKGTKDEALDILCDAGILSGADCAFFKAGGEAPEAAKGPNLTAIFVGFFILLILLITIAALYKRFSKKETK